jgi:hypothetical protein
MLITPAFENVLFELFKIITEIMKINQDPFGMNRGVLLFRSAARLITANRATRLFLSS